MSTEYRCNNCGALLNPDDKYCPKCGSDLSKVGRAIRKSVFEVIGLSDNQRLSNAVTGSFSNVSGDIVTSSSILTAIPKEKREEIGIDEKTYTAILGLREVIEKLQKQPPFVDLRGSIINAPINITKEGNNIVLSVNIDESFNRLSKEIEQMQIDPSTKETMVYKAEELRQEVSKEHPDASKARKAFEELKTLLPMSLTVAQIGVILAKIFFGVG